MKNVVSLALALCQKFLRAKFNPTKFKESALAHKYLDGFVGIEIGGSAHNPFGLNTKNVDYTGDMNTEFKQAEERSCREKMPVDIIAEGDDLPLRDEAVDFVISSHVIEHFFDPVKTINEWMRVIKKGGYIFIIAPHVDRVPDEHRPPTKLEEIIARHEGKMKPEDVNFEGGHGESATAEGNARGHWSVWNLEEFLKICDHYGFNVIETEDPDQKVGNGFTVLIQKQ